MIRGLPDVPTSSPILLPGTSPNSRAFQRINPPPFHSTPILVDAGN